MSGRDLEQVFGGFEGRFVEPFNAELRVYLSSNGLNWRRVSGADGLPDSFYAFSGAPLGDGVALLGWDQRGDGGQQLWIGSPAA